MVYVFKKNVKTLFFFFFNAYLQSACTVHRLPSAVCRLPFAVRRLPSAVHPHPFSQMQRKFNKSHFFYISLHLIKLIFIFLKYKTDYL
ncbi:MAG TPA: hypothetical protein ENJ53_06230 [Phaeodactylibacter sp.]|nr:hypothetical protein [Phaeodactylibacter sp.]